MSAPGLQVLRDVVRLQQAEQRVPGVHQEAELRDAECREGIVESYDDFGIGQRRRRADDVEVALDELPEPSLPGAVRPPDRSDGVSLVRHGELAAVRRRGAGQGNREVVPQREIRLPARFVFATAEDLEDELVALVAVLAGEHVETLEGRCLERLEAEAGEHRTDGREGALTLLEFGCEEIPGPGRGIELL